MVKFFVQSDLRPLPLQGQNILVTRPVHQADNLCNLIEQNGGIAIRFPTIEIAAIDAPKILLKPDWYIFTSANAVNFALKLNDGKISEFIDVPIAAIGRATAKCLENSGLPVNLVPEKGFDSEALLASPELQQVQGKKITIVRGQGGREELAAILQKRGAEVNFLEVYRRLIPNYDKSLLPDLLNTGKLPMLIATSGEALNNLFAMVRVGCHPLLVQLPLVVISERIRQFAVTKGFSRIAVSENPSDQAVLETIITIFNGE